VGILSSKDTNNSSIHVFKHFKMSVVTAVIVVRAQKYSKGTMMPCEPIYTTARGMGAAGRRTTGAANQFLN
jgi:hypothetical protein